jgi:hypothetical protein
LLLLLNTHIYYTYEYNYIFIIYICIYIYKLLIVNTMYKNGNTWIKLNWIEYGYCVKKQDIYFPANLSASLTVLVLKIMPNKIVN